MGDGMELVDSLSFSSEPRRLRLTSVSIQMLMLALPIMRAAARLLRTCVNVGGCTRHDDVGTRSQVNEVGPP